VAFGSGGPFTERPPLPVASDALGNTRETARPTVGLVGSFRGVSGADRCKTVQAIGRLRSLPSRLNDLLSVRQVAARLGVSTATVYKLCEGGELPHTRISNAIRVAPTDLEAFLSRNRSRAR
jgi:excisionase family DNA binding protein